jgi:hypothetical protein
VFLPGQDDGRNLSGQRTDLPEQQPDNLPALYRTVGEPEAPTAPVDLKELPP